jgi:hypothetical protein
VPLEEKDQSGKRSSPYQAINHFVTLRHLRYDNRIEEEEALTPLLRYFLFGFPVHFFLSLMNISAGVGLGATMTPLEPQPFPVLH